MQRVVEVGKSGCLEGQGVGACRDLVWAARRCGRGGRTPVTGRRTLLGECRISGGQDPICVGDVWKRVGAGRNCVEVGCNAWKVMWRFAEVVWQLREGSCRFGEAGETCLEIAERGREVPRGPLQGASESSEHVSTSSEEAKRLVFGQFRADEVARTSAEGALQAELGASERQIVARDLSERARTAGERERPSDKEVRQRVKRPWKSDD